MTVRSRPALPQAGSTLFLVLILAGATLTVVATALSLAANRNLIATRSTAWNSALPLAEAGVEEALTQIQYGNSATNGWRLTNGFYVKTVSNPFGDQDNDCFYSVTITPTNPPTITSAGYVRAPLRSTYLSRTVQVTTTNAGLFPYGMLAKNLITISGGSTLNSFNSADPRYSNLGMYSPSKAHDQIKVATLSGAAPAIKVGTGKIYGYAATGASGTVTYGSGGSVGDTNWVSGGSTGGQTGHISNTMNANIPDVGAPYSFGTAPYTGTVTVNGTNYTSTLTANTNYYSGNYTIAGGQSLVITNHAVFYVTGSFTVSGSGFIYLTPGASLALYVGTTNLSANNSITISGGGVANGTGVASNFAVWGLPSVQTTTFSGSAQFIGTSYTPEAALTLSGSADGCGAVVANTITLSGGMNFHYDEALAGGNGLLKYLITSWREL